MKFTRNYVRVFSGVLFAIALWIVSGNVILGVIAAMAMLSTLFFPDRVVSSLTCKGVMKAPPVIAIVYFWLDVVPAAIPMIFFSFYGNPILMFMATAFFAFDMYTAANIRYTTMYQRAYSVVRKSKKRKVGAPSDEDILKEDAELLKESLEEKVEEIAAPKKKSFFKSLFTKKETVEEVEGDSLKKESIPTEEAPKKESASPAPAAPAAKKIVAEKTAAPKTPGKKRGPKPESVAPDTLAKFQKAIEGFDKPRLVKFIKRVLPTVKISGSMKADTLISKVEAFYGVT